MKSSLNRRAFIQRSVLAAGAVLAFPHIGSASARKPLDKLNCVQVGCGGRAMTHLEQVIVTHGQNLVAIVDPDERSQGRVSTYLKGKGIDPSPIGAFNDYRVMFDKMGKEHRRGFCRDAQPSSS